MTKYRTFGYQGSPKLTAEQVMYVLSTRPHVDYAKDIANELGVSVSAINHIRQGKSWANLEKIKKTTKKCTTCKKDKPFTDYFKANTPDGLRNRCKECHNKSNSEWRGSTVKGQEYNRRQARTSRARYSYGKSAAKRRGIEFTLSVEEFIYILSSGKCHYCGYDINEYGVGLDRKDNSHGYIMENVVPCCAECNKVKNDIFTYGEMIELGKTVKHIKDNRADGEKKTKKWG